ncbi:MAG: cohesin domain-containing protein [Acidobacteriota bacterium]|nr:cohesin domain-containing protein [Acidobacteriota bacterium]
MKKAAQKKRNKIASKNMSSRFLWNKITASFELKEKFRQLLSLVFVYALVFVPLLTFDSAVPRAQAQVGNTCGESAEQIFQNCPFGPAAGSFPQDLTNQAINDVIEFYKLPATLESRNLVLKYARNEIRSMLYARLLAVLKKQSPTASEQAGIDGFIQFIKARRVLAASKAIEEYNKWNETKCTTYQPPAPYTYEIPGGCNRLAGFFNPPKPPSFEEFQAFGAVRAYGDLFTPQAQDVSQKTTAGIAAGVGAGTAALGGIAAYAAGTAVTFGTLSAILPYAGIAISPITGSFVFPAAAASSGTIGGTAAAGPAAIILLAVAASVIEGIAVANASQLPGKLQEALTNAQNQHFTQYDFTYDEASNQEIYGAFLRATLPDFPGTGAPAPSASDLSFITRTDGASGTANNNTITYVDWDGVCRIARLSGGWFVDKKVSDGVELMQLSIRYLDWNGEKRIASRNATSFLLTTPGNVNASEKVSELTYKDCNGVKRGASIKFQQLKAYLKELERIGCGTGSNTQTRILGSILERSQPAVNMTVTANGASSATVSGITINNLTVNSNYDITANISSNSDVPIPTTVNFTIVVNNVVSQTEPMTITVRKTAVADDFPASEYLPNGVVNQPYSFNLSNPSQPSLACSTLFNVSVTGELPPGIVLSESPVNSLKFVLNGTPRSGGKYTFTVHKNIENGETLSRTFSILVKSDIADLPNGLVSWWRAEKDAEDTTGKNKLTQVGSVGYTTGKVNSAWRFNGSNSYIAIPNSTFRNYYGESLDYTFELWFKTGTKGVIVGRQGADKNPYDAQLFGYSPMIYVHQNGKLHVNMFTNGNLTISPNRVDDNQFHHVAIVFTRNGNSRTTYLDGVPLGTFNGDVRSVSNYDKFQFGTGYVYEGTMGGMNGWFNFNGIIDEAALYNRAASPDEIKKIYAAGNAGKISIETFATPPFQRDGNTGSITITAEGGIPALRYSIDNGATFKDTSFFPNLAPGTYTVVVKDGANNTITRTAVVTNPPPSLSLRTEVINPQCPNGAGEIRITATGATGDVEYSIRNGANRQSTGVFTGIASGTYMPWIRDIATDTVYEGAGVSVTAPPPVQISPSNFVNAAVGVPYSRTFTFSGGTPSLAISVSGEDINTGYALPVGLTATGEGNAITISGTPQQAGTYSFFFRTDDSKGCYAGFRIPLIVTTNQTYGISGKVTNGGQGLANVIITLAGGENRTTTTDAAGNYSLPTIAGGANYTITASLNGMIFAQPTLTFNNLNANYTNANFATAATTYEGDISPRTTGDGAINVLDLVALGRMLMANNPDAPPAIGAEYHRADTDPRASLGNGAIDQNDLTQIRRYILGTNPKTPAGGAIAPASAAANQTAANQNASDKSSKSDWAEAVSPSEKTNAVVDTATISVDTVAYQGSTVAVPVRFNSNGNIAAIQFTLTYDVNKIFLNSITGGSAMPANTTVIIDWDTPGQVKYLAYRPIDGASVFPAGEQELMVLRFSVNQNATGTARIDFANSPAPRIASDTQANAVILEGTPGKVTITPVQSISGAVKYAIVPVNSGSQKAVPAVLLSTSGSSDMSDTDGAYSLEDLTPGSSYVVTPSKTGDINGITAFDATLILRNAAAAGQGANALTTIQQKAADANRDGVVTAFDAVMILRFVAAGGTNPQTGNVGKWKFAPESVVYQSLTTSLPAENYEAILVGEVSGDWSPSFGSSTNIAEENVSEAKDGNIIIPDDTDASVLIANSAADSILIKESKSDIETVEKTEENVGFDRKKHQTHAEIELKLPENVSGRIGEIVMVPVYFINPADKQIAAYNFAVNFDPAVLQLAADETMAAVEAVSSLSENGFVIASDASVSGRIRVAAAALNNTIASTGTLLFLRFKVVGANVSSISFESTKRNGGMFEDTFGKKMTFATNNGYFVGLTK